MPRKPAVIEPETEELDADYEEQALPDLSDEERKLAELVGVFDELGDNTDISTSIYKKNEATGKHDLVDLIEGPLTDSPESVLLQLRKVYGGGMYRFAIRIKGEVGLRKNVHVSVAGDPNPKLGRNSDGGDDSASAIVELIRQRDERYQEMMRDMFTSMKTATEANKPRPPMTAQEMVTLATGVIAAMGTLKDTLLPKQQDPLKLVRELMDLKAEVTGGISEREPTTMDLLLKGITALGGLSQNKSLAGMLSPSSQVPVPVNNPSTNSEQVTETASGPEKTIDPFEEALGKIIPILLNGANKDGDPTLYAEMVIDLLPDDPRIDAMLGNNQLIPLIGQLVPALNGHEAWLRQVENAMIQCLTEPDEESPSDAGHGTPLIVTPPMGDTMPATGTGSGGDSPDA